MLVDWHKTEGVLSYTSINTGPNRIIIRWSVLEQDGQVFYTPIYYCENRDNLRHGPCVRWHHNGKLSLIINYVDDNISGEMIIINHSGVIKSNVIYLWEEEHYRYVRHDVENLSNEDKFALALQYKDCSLLGDIDEMSHKYKSLCSKILQDVKLVLHSP